MLLAFAMVLSSVSLQGAAAGNTKALQSSVTKSVDQATYTERVLTEEQKLDTRESGRVWVDKSVMDQDFTVDNVAVQNGESDFTVMFSTTSSSTIVLEKQPIDTMFVLDFSASMNWDSTGTEATTRENSRILAMVNALNNAIDTLIKTNPENRIGIAVFSGTASEMLPMTSGRDILKKVTDKEYISLSHYALKEKETEEAKQEADSTVKCNINNVEIKTAGGTNIQAGLALGMNVLANESNTTVQLEDGTTVTRIPNVVFMSDGAPTTFASASDCEYYLNKEDTLTTGYLTRSDTVRYETVDGNRVFDPVESGSWWKEDLGKEAIGSGDNNNPDDADGFMALLSATYLKEKITKNYYPDGDGAASVYTIGFSTNHQTDGMVEMSGLVLNPQVNWNTVTNPSVQGVVTAWVTFKARKPVTVKAPLGKASNTYKIDYNVAFPTGWNPENPFYVDQYYEASNAGSLNSAFAQIINNIISAAKSPTQVEGDPTVSGYITYVDELGEFMNVDSMKGIIYQNTLFENPTTEAIPGGTRYRFSGTVYSEVYGEQELANLCVDVTAGTNNNQVVTVRVPASLIPIRTNTITLASDGTVASNESTDTEPLHVIYGVSLQEGILDAEGNVTEEFKTNHADYIATHTDAEDGTVYFRSNLFTANEANGVSVGNTYAEYTVAMDNPFYYSQVNIPLYDDAGLTVPATGPIDANKTYYFNWSYYAGVTEQVRVVPVLGKDITHPELLKDDGAGLYIPVGYPVLGELVDFIQYKDTAVTPANGAATSKYPLHEGDSASPQVKIWLGNNGTLYSASMPGDFAVTKEVNWNGNSLPAQTPEFVMQITAMKADKTPLEGTFAIEGTNETVTFTNGNASFSVANGETKTVVGVPAGTTVQVAEEDVAGYEPSYDKTEITVKSNTTETITVNNKYTPEAASLILKGTKYMKGDRDQVLDNEFGFTAVETDQFGNVLANGRSASGTNNAKGEITFSSITFTTAGEYYFKITENKVTTPGVRAGGESYNVIVRVADSGTGKLEASVSMEAGVSEVAFTNYYEPAGVDLTLPMDKLLTGRDLVAGEFSAIITPARTNDENDPLQGKTRVVPFNESHAETILHYDHAGVYQYTVEEDASSALGGIKYDDTVYEVTVTVRDDNGTLRAGYTIADNHSKIEFNNEYTAKDVMIRIPGHKTTEVHNSGVLSDYTFGYVVREAKTGKLVASATSMPGGDAEGNLFDVPLTFNKAGTYTYTFGEIAGDATGPEFDAEGNVISSGVEYDDDLYTITVKVEDDKKGALHATWIAEEHGQVVATSEDTTPRPMVFENEYYGDTAVLNLTAKKELTGRALAADEFHFAVYEGDKLVASGTNDAQGAVSFTSISYTEEDAGEHVYTVKEIKPTTEAGPSYIQYSDDAYTVKVVVSKENGQLNASLQSIEKDGVVVTEMSFENTYTPDGVVVPLKAVKKLESKAGLTVQPGAFRFQLSGDTLSEPVIVTNGGVGIADNEILFPSQTFTKEMLGNAMEKTFTYTVKELDDKQTGFTYSKEEYTIEITVTDDGNGKLKEKTVITNKAGEAVTTGMEFVNTYKPEKTSMKLDLEKKLTGRDLKADEFGFKVQMQNGNDWVDVASATNTKEGQFETSEISFEEEGEYTLKVTENDGAAERVTYDKTVYYVEVTVGDVNGALKPDITAIRKVNVDGTEEEVDAIVFNNTYTPVPTPQDPEDPDNPDNPDKPGTPDTPGGSSGSSSKSPKTGDTSNPWIWAILLLGSGFFVARTTMSSKKRRRR